MVGRAKWRHRLRAAFVVLLGRSLVYRVHLSHNGAFRGLGRKGQVDVDRAPEFLQVTIADGMGFEVESDGKFMTFFNGLTAPVESIDPLP